MPVAVLLRDHHNGIGIFVEERHIEFKLLTENGLTVNNNRFLAKFFPRLLEKPIEINASIARWLTTAVPDVWPV